MARPNIASASAIYAGATGLRLVATGPTLIVSNAASSGKVYFVESVCVANTDTSNAVSVSIQHWNNATPGTAGATGVSLCSTISVPANASLLVVSKDNAEQLLEGESLSITPGTASKLDVTCDWKEIS